MPHRRRGDCCPCPQPLARASAGLVRQPAHCGLDGLEDQPSLPSTLRRHQQRVDQDGGAIRWLGVLARAQARGPFRADAAWRHDEQAVLQLHDISAGCLHLPGAALHWGRLHGSLHRHHRPQEGSRRGIVRGLPPLQLVRDPQRHGRRLVLPVHAVQGLPAEVPLHGELPVHRAAGAHGRRQPASELARRRSRGVRVRDLPLRALRAAGAAQRELRGAAGGEARRRGEDGQRQVHAHEPAPALGSLERCGPQQRRPRPP
mmetsp:Transcript_61013/g.196566  ORF Transcript_61013/g.196566 Transcript_61013/m.196566 type:complete len:259 (-) Transcript_61013:695-1471(-)